MDASGAVRPSRVTTSKPTLWPARLTSPTKASYHIMCYSERRGRYHIKCFRTSVEALKLDGGIDSEGLQHSHNQSAFSHTLIRSINQIKID